VLVIESVACSLSEACRYRTGLNNTSLEGVAAFKFSEANLKVTVAQKMFDHDVNTTRATALAWSWPSTHLWPLIVLKFDHEPLGFQEKFDWEKVSLDEIIIATQWSGRGKMITMSTSYRSYHTMSFKGNHDAD
jgi:hypothetical protein